MDSQTCKALVRKQGAVKTKMTHIKKHIDSLPDTADMDDVNVRLQLLWKVREEYNVEQDQLEYDDDDETQQHELDREAFTEITVNWKLGLIEWFQKTEEQETLVQQNHRSIEQHMTMAIV